MITITKTMSSWVAICVEWWMINVDEIARLGQSVWWTTYFAGGKSVE